MANIQVAHAPHELIARPCTLAIALSEMHGKAHARPSHPREGVQPVHPCANPWPATHRSKQLNGGIHHEPTSGWHDGKGAWHIENTGIPPEEDGRDPGRGFRGIPALSRQASDKRHHPQMAWYRDPAAPVSEMWALVLMPPTSNPLKTIRETTTLRSEVA